MDIPYKNPVVHDTNPSSFTGDYELTDQALKNYKVERENFGTTEVILPDGSSFRVKDYQYVLPDGSVGMHFVPVSNNTSIIGPDGIARSGDYFIDQFLRNEMNLAETDPIFALVNYFHPEQNKGTIKELLMSPDSDKIEIGFTHLGAYRGKGYTTNAPMLYHAHKFGVTGEANGTIFGYPANIQIVSLKGVPQVTLNKNFSYVDTCLNSGVMFPDKSPMSYKMSKFRVVDINTALMFYRDWINFEGYLRADDSWYTYCAAHKTVVATVALNLPHNLKSFQEVYGDAEGKDLFEKFKIFYNNIVGPDPGFLESNETDFEPLWKQQGFTPDQISPFTLEEYKAYETARIERKINSFNGKIPLKPEEATGWAPQTSAEIVFDIIQIYADMLDAGPIISCAIILGFMDKIDERMGINNVTYLLYAMPIVEKLMIAHASIYAANSPDTYLITTFGELVVAFGGDASGIDLDADIKRLKALKDNPEGLLNFVKSNPGAEAIATWALIGVVEDWDAIIRAGAIAPETAYVTFMENSRDDLEKAKELYITDPSKIEYNTPPAFTHLMCNGMYNSNPLVTVKELCTVIDVSEIQLKK